MRVQDASEDFECIPNLNYVQDLSLFQKLATLSLINSLIVISNPYKKKTKVTTMTIFSIENKKRRKIPNQRQKIN